MPLQDILLGVTKGIAGAAGNQSAVADIAGQQQQRAQQRQQQLQMQIAPLAQSLQADQTRLAIFADPADPTRAAEGKGQQYEETLRRMESTIGQMRTLMGAPPPKEGLLDHLHIRRDLAHRAASWRQGNAQQAGAMAAGALPHAQTEAGQKESATESANARRDEQQHKYAMEEQAAKPIKPGAEKAVWLKDADGTQHPYELKDGKYVPVDAPEGATPTAAKPDDTEYKKATLDLRNKQLAFSMAKFNATLNPHNPSTKAAEIRAAAELERAKATMIRAQAGAFGTYEGKPLPGAVTTTEGTPIGSMFASHYVKSAQSMAQLNDAGGAINNLNDALKNLYASGGSLNSIPISEALQHHDWSAAQIAQGVVAQTLSPEEREAVTAIVSARENIQGMRKSAGGGVSDKQVDRLEAQLPGPETPNADYANSQIKWLNQTLQRLSEGVPVTVGGHEFKWETGTPEGAGTQALRGMAAAASRSGQDTFIYARDPSGKLHRAKQGTKLPKGWTIDNGPAQ